MSVRSGKVKDYNGKIKTGRGMRKGEKEYFITYMMKYSSTFLCVRHLFGKNINIDLSAAAVCRTDNCLHNIT